MDPALGKPRGYAAAKASRPRAQGDGRRSREACRAQSVKPTGLRTQPRQCDPLVNSTFFARLTSRLRGVPEALITFGIGPRGHSGTARESGGIAGTELGRLKLGLECRMSDTAQRQTQPAEPWYADGLRFSCTQCGNCCTGPPGFVWFNQSELEAMAAYLGLTQREFLNRYCDVYGSRWSIRDAWNPEVQGHDCVFLQRDESGKALCGIYPVRPGQCRTWPFWPSNLRSERAYRRATKTCPGAQHGLKQGEGTFYPVEQIRILRDRTPEM